VKEAAMIGSFYRFWLACAVVALGGVIHTFWLAPDAWDGLQAMPLQAGAVSFSCWDYVRGAMVLLPGIGLVVMWERSQKRKSGVIPTRYAEETEFQDERVAA
jgi:hypothetical protein